MQHLKSILDLKSYIFIKFIKPYLLYFLLIYASVSGSGPDVEGGFVHGQRDCMG